MKQLQWGILGTGQIAKTFAHALTHSSAGQLVAVGSRTPASAGIFANCHGVTACHGSYEALLADPSVEAVYISTPHPFHAEWTIKAAQAGKHVLCEKPLAMNQVQGEVAIEAARKAGIFLSEAFMYRFHPQTAKLVELIRDGIIGEVRMIRASFGFDVGNGYNPESRLFNNALGGGGILDVGCYAVSGARLIAGAAIGKAFDNPVKVVGSGNTGESGVDEWAAAVLQFSSGITAQVATSIRAQIGECLVVVGSEGYLTVPNPWVADREHPAKGVIIVTKDGVSREFEVPARATCFALEADAVARAIASGQCEPDSPGMTWDDSLGNLAVLDEWRRQVGVTYSNEQVP